MLGITLANRYNVLGELGRGGMGVVYRARDMVLSRDVAIKLVSLRGLAADHEERFRREAQLVAQMDHPAIVPIYDFGQDDTTASLFFVMPVVPGSTLRWRMNTQPLSLGEILDLGIQAADALDYSHERGAIHRDIKPENLMVEPSGAGIRVRVLDFGLARSRGPRKKVTGSGVVLGTLGYLSPEQVSGEEVDARTDIYSLGLILHECLVGETAFAGDYHMVIYRILNDVPPSPRALGLPVAEELDRVVMRCLEKKPGSRPQRAADLREELRFLSTRSSEADRELIPASAPRAIRARGPVFPFINRRKEFSELGRCLDHAEAGDCHLAVVGGGAGIGKTRLLQELETLAHARGIRVLTGRFGDLERSFPYQGFCDLIQYYFRETERSAGRIVDLSDLSQGLVALFPILGEISAMRSHGSTEITAAPQVDPRLPVARRPDERTTIYELLTRTISRLAGGKPLMVVLENLHHAEISNEALQYIVRRLGNTPTLFVATYRTEEVDRKHSVRQLIESFRNDRHFTHLELKPFSESDHRPFVESLLDGDGLSDALARRLFETSEGNPYFTKELVRVLRESGAILRQQTGLWTLPGPGPYREDQLPETIQQVVERRIQKLEPVLREVLSTASVLGRRFESRDLEALAGQEALTDALDRLIEEGLIEEEPGSRGRRLAFTSSLVRDVLYAGLPRRKRKTLHRTCAEQLESRHPGRAGRVRAALLYHYVHADVASKAVEYALLSAQEALRAFSLEEAVRAAKTALDFLVDVERTEDAASEVESRILLSAAYRAMGNIGNALVELDIARSVCAAATGLGSQRLQTAILLSEMSWEALRTDDARRHAEEAMELAREMSDSESLARILSLAATVAGLRGEHQQALAYLEEKSRLEAGRPGGATAESPRGGSLVVALPTPLMVIDPARSLTLDEVEVLACCFETLMTVDEDGHVLPNLCHAIEMADSGKRFILTLRSGVTFHDGAPLTATHVKAAIERTLRLAVTAVPPAFSVLSRSPDGLSAVTVVSDSKLELCLEVSTPNYAGLLTDVRTAIAREGDAGPEGILLGTGPFRLMEPAPSRKAVLHRFDSWWQGVSPPLEALEFWSGMAADAIAAGVRSGHVDVGRDLLPEDLEEFLRDPRFRHGIVEASKKTTYFALFNTFRTLGGKEGFRKALSRVVDPQALVWRTLGRFAQPAMGLIPPGIAGHDAGRRTSHVDPETASELMSSEGLSAPIELRVALHPAFQDRFRSLTSSLFELWSALGVRVKVVTSTMESFLSSFNEASDIDLWIGRWTADYDDPANFTLDLFQSRHGQLRAYHSSAETDQMLEEARVQEQPGLREGLFHRFEKKLIDAGILIPLFFDVSYRVAGSTVLDLRLSSHAPFVNYHQVAKARHPAAPGPVPSRHGILRIPVTGDLSSLDPVLSDTAEASEILSTIAEPLTRVTEGAQIVPWLAREIHSELGGRRFRFVLRENVRFHDGRRLSARDVRFTFERLCRSNRSVSSWLMARVRGAKALAAGEATELSGFTILSPSELTIELGEPLQIFPTLLSDPVTGILPEGSFPDRLSWKEGFVGTGPFRLVKFEPGSRVELEANPAYWREGLPRSEGLIFHLKESPDEIVSGFRAGRFALASDLRPDQVESLRRDPVFGPRHRQKPRLCTYLLAANIRGGPLSDRAYRRRLMAAIDVHGLVLRHLGGVALPASGLIPPGILPRRRTDLTPVAQLPPEPHEAGEPLVANVHPAFEEEYGLLALELFSSLSARGFDVLHPRREISEYMDHHRAGTSDLLLGRWVADYPDPDTFAGILHSRSGGLGHYCGTKELDDLIEQAAAERDPATRRALYLRLEEHIREEALLLPLFHEQLYRFVRPEVMGFELSFTSPNVAYERLSLDS